MKLFLKIVLFASILYISYYCLEFLDYYNYKQKAQIIINKISLYRNSHSNKLPDNLIELNIEESMGNGPYYKKIDSSNYIIYYNIGLDNSTLTYYSFSKEWLFNK